MYTLYADYIVYSLFVIIVYFHADNEYHIYMVRSKCLSSHKGCNSIKMLAYWSILRCDTSV